MNIIEFIKTHKNNLTYEQLNEFIKNNPNNLNYVDGTNKNVLMYAIIYIYDIKIFELLLINGVVINDNEKLLMIACDYNIDVEVIKLLVKNGLNLHNYFKYYKCGKKWYNQSICCDFLLFVINNGANVNINANLLGYTLIDASISYRYNYIKLLIKNNINTFVDKIDVSYLRLVLYENNNTLNLLINNGFVLNYSNESKKMLNIYTKNKKKILQKYYFSYRKII